LTTPLPAATEFIDRWQRSGAAERANYQLFLAELCDVLEVPRPDPAQPDDTRNGYVFERAVSFQNPDGTTSPGRIDLYKRGCFVLEAKQGSEKQEAAPGLFADAPKKAKKGTAVRGTAGWDVAMLKARGQAEQYAKALPTREGWPVFLLVVDIGHTFELYADFTRAGKTYLPFPDAASFRVKLPELAKAEIRERLRLVWTEPLALDPARRSARITREVAAKLAALAKSFEETGYAPETVAAFLMRCLFTMFAEDVQLIPAGRFAELLASRRDKLHTFQPMLESLWATMNTGGFSPILEEHVLKFNGGLFESSQALPVNRAQLELLIEASRSDWREVEPAIFGTLLERALDPVERHKLGAHYTPRAYVERLVLPTVIEPLREQWKDVQTAAVTLAQEGKLEAAAALVKDFHHELCEVRVLDPACGSGNFLYVTLEHLKRLEGEIINALNDFDARQAAFEIEGFTVDPHQLLGLELNPRAAAIADLVLWIGYLQWHFRTRGDARPSEPVLRKFRNIECRDAVLTFDRREIVTGEDGQPVTRWDGRTFKTHPVTGEAVPDEAARTPLYAYVNARKAEWPAADYVVGNPPFIGNKRMRITLGDGYVETLRTIQTDVPDNVDYVMYWWNHAAELVCQGKLRQFGLVSTNSITQPFNRRILQRHLDNKEGVSLTFAIPDHPWVDTEDGAAVRISMTLGKQGHHWGTLAKMIAEEVSDGDGTKVTLSAAQGKINSNLSIGADVAGATRLTSNIGLSFMGVTLVGDGFRLTSDEVQQLGYQLEKLPPVIKPYVSGREIAQQRLMRYVIDLFSLSRDGVLQNYPPLYQWLLDRVKPFRDQNKRQSYKDRWWIFGEPRSAMREALKSLDRYIATLETSKHRFFVFLSSDVVPDHSLFVVALNDAYTLGVLSSKVHLTWALAAGSTLEDRPRWRNVTCFEPFPFPDCNAAQQSHIRALGEQLDAHRKRQQALHPDLTLTEMYNVLEKERTGTPLTDKERATHERGLIAVLRQLHDELDAAVADGYGWPADLPDEEILVRLVALNAERTREEQAGHIRWLRPEYQKPAGVQTALDTGEISTESGSDRVRPTAAKFPWPKTLPEQAAALRAALATQTGLATAADLAKSFKGARAATVENLLHTLVSLGLAREVEPNRFAG
jgi:SAM-dependent methyltransferase